MSISKNQQLVLKIQERMGLHSDIYVNDKVNYPINITCKITSMSWTRTSMEKTLVRLFEKVTARPLTIHLKNRMVLPKGKWNNHLTANLTDDGYGLLTFLYVFGAMPRMVWMSYLNLFVPTEVK